MHFSLRALSSASFRSVVCYSLVLCAAVCFRATTHGCQSGKKNSAGVEKTSSTITLKIGALFDVRARHLTETFQSAVRAQNKEQLEQADELNRNDVGNRDDVIKVLLDPVITFVDITDSFAVSNAMCDLIAHDVIAIVGVTNASSLPTIQSYSATFNVPFLSLGSAQNVTSSAPFQLSLRPPLMAAFVDLIHHHGCGSALYLYDSDEGLMRIQDLFQAINVRELYLELDVRRIVEKGHVTELSRIIGSMHPRRDLCLILDAERLDVVFIVNMFADAISSIKDVILVTLDSAILLAELVQDSSKNRPFGFKAFNVSGLQLVPSHFHSFSLHPKYHNHLQKWSRWTTQDDNVHYSLPNQNFYSRYYPHHHPKYVLYSHVHKDLERLTQKIDDEEHRASSEGRTASEEGATSKLDSGKLPATSDQNGGKLSPERSSRKRSSEKGFAASRKNVGKEGGTLLQEQEKDSFKTDKSFTPEDAFKSDNSFTSKDTFKSENSLKPEDTFTSENSFTSEEAFQSESSFTPEDSFTDIADDQPRVDKLYDSDNLRQSTFHPRFYHPGATHLDETHSKPRRPSATHGEPISSSEALIADCLKVLITALTDLWETLGDVIENGSDVMQEDLSIKCTNFVVEKKQYGAEVMEALRLVHIHGETRYISFDVSGKREDYTLSVLSVMAGSTRIMHESEWSSVSGMTSHSASREGMRSYTIFGNMSHSIGRKAFVEVVE